MNISGIGMSPQTNTSSKQSSLDNYETKLRKEISTLQEEMKSISNDKKMTDDQKTKKKQAVQEEIQNLNTELRQHQIEKRQEEAAKKQEALKKASEEANKGTGIDSDDENADQKPVVYGSEELGVLITLSNTKTQMTGMQKVRTSLEGQQRTAATEEEKADIQKKINNVSKGIGQKIVITEDTIADFRKTKAAGTDTQQKKETSSAQKDRTWKVYTEDNLEASTRKNLFNNQNLMFENVSVVAGR